MTEHIKIGDITPRIQYEASGTETVFSYPFPVFSADDLRVYVDDTLQTPGTHYAVDGVGEDQGGAITFSIAPAPAAAVTIVRHLSIARTSDFQESGEFRASVINDELDKIIAMIQEIAEAIDRAVHLSATDRAAALTLPARTARANAYLAFDSKGAPIAAVEPGSYPASTFISTLLDDEDAAAARTTLGALAPDGDGSQLTGIAIGGPGPALGSESVIRTNAKTISENITFAGTENGMTAGPVTIADTFTVTVTRGSTWTIVGG